MTPSRKIVLAASLAFFTLWIVLNAPRICSDEDASIRLVLQILFAAVILFRRKPDEKPKSLLPVRFVPVLAALSAGLAVAGIVFRVHQFEWLGLVMVVYCCLRWALPAKFSRDVATAAFLLYWLHPLPSVLLGSVQLAMQNLSVIGSEAALHAVNVPVWADGLFLRAGFQTFGVPEACSGLRTGVTVLLATLGVCVIFRMRWLETAVFLALGLLQVLLLNIARIVFVVIWSARMPPEWSQGFLHDTLGLFLLVAMMIVQAEVVWWRTFSVRRRERLLEISRGIRERPERGPVLPHFWRRAVKWGWIFLVVLTVAAAAGAVIWKLRPYHRGSMIARIVDDRMRQDPRVARRAAEAALALIPGDREMLSRCLQASVLDGDFSRALAEVEKLPQPLSVFEIVLKSWALMALGKPEEAVEVIDSLPADSQRLPGVAIVRAEYAAMRDCPEDVAENVVLAANSQVPVNRIRSLFPYMATHEQWAAISACDNPSVPYGTFDQALISVHAGLRARDIGRAALAMRQGLRQWPDDPRFLDSLFMFASAKPGGEWEDRFALGFRANVAKMDADTLSVYLNYCFRLGSPDLAWMAHRRLASLDPDDPALSLAAAQHGGAWFSMRRSLAGLVGGDQASEAGMNAALAQTYGMRPFAGAWESIPLLNTMLQGRPDAMRGEYTRKCLAELSAREARGSLPLRMEMMFPPALAIENRFAEAHERLESIVSRYPAMKEEVLFQHAVLYDQEARWQEAYEAVRRYRQEVKLPNLTAELLMVNAMMNLDMGLPAMETVRLAALTFPGTPAVATAEAAIWDVFGFNEQALHVIFAAGGGNDNRAVAQLLYDTGRIRDAEKMANVLGVRIRTRSPPPGQNLVPEPAENVFRKRLPPPLTEAQIGAEVEKARKWLPGAKSPFLEKLTRLMLAFYEGTGAEAAKRMEEWSAGWRDDMEAGTALYRLSMMCARQGDFDGALEAVRAAIERMPRSAMLWRIRLAMGDNGPETVDAAFSACPDDPDLWLASVVSGVVRQKGAEWSEGRIREAVSGKRYSSGTLVRAGDFLFRRGMTNAASLAAGGAMTDSPGLLSAQVLGYNCAVAAKDWDAALACALRGIEHAANPAPFYKAVVVVKTVRKNPDADLLAALEYLRRQFPEEFQWSEHAAWVYFQKGDMRRSLSILGPLIGGNLRGMRVQSLLIASEAARIEGIQKRAVGILEAAHAMYPEKASILNNLVYNLAQDQATVARARELLPGLLQIGGDSYAILDTAAFVYLRSGQLERAREYMRRALTAAGDADYGVHEVRLNAAEILLRSGDYTAARQQIQGVRQDKTRSELVDMRAVELLRELDIRVKKK